ncbi:hypothetical protein O4H61_19030 [Roseovarius aestuarii]|nr:hypothetical protein [Roseovarius aestuarii]
MKSSLIEGPNTNRDRSADLREFGRQAEREFNGTSRGGAGGDAQGDLEKATRRALGIVRTSGLGDAGEFWHEDLEHTQFTLSRDRNLQRRVQQHLTAADARATKNVKANRNILDRLATSLGKKTVVKGEELTGLLSGVEMCVTGQNGDASVLRLQNVAGTGKYPPLAYVIKRRDRLMEGVLDQPLARR